MATTMKLIEAIEDAAVRLKAAGVSFGHGTTNAFDEAVWLVLWKLRLPLDSLDQHDQKRLSPALLKHIDDVISERIATRKPAAYLTGEAWLHGLPFYVDENVIVPRSLIAEPLLDGVLDDWLPPKAVELLDLCTGNGSLAVMAAIAWPELKITAADVSTPALAVAKRNVHRHEVDDRVQLAQGDGFAAVAGRRFDVILCNPPYVNSTSMANLPPEYKAEPALALDGGIDGMDFVRGLLSHAQAFMTPHAILVLEIGHEIDHFRRAFEGLSALWLETSGGPASVALVTREALVDFNAKRRAGR